MLLQNPMANLFNESKSIPWVRRVTPFGADRAGFAYVFFASADQKNLYNGIFLQDSGATA